MSKILQLPLAVCRQEKLPRHKLGLASMVEDDLGFLLSRPSFIRAIKVTVSPVTRSRGDLARQLL